MPGEARLTIEAKVSGESPDRPRLDVDLEITGGITIVMGPSGAGKTTLLTTVAGLVRPDAGRIMLGSTVLFDSEVGAFVPVHRRNIALVFQSLALFPHLTAWENVAYGLSRARKATRRASALAWLERLCIPLALADQLPGSLSGGEAQRVAIARAVASAPRALLLDEPFSALDEGLRGELGIELCKLIEELDIPALLVTHHHEDAAKLGSRVLVLQHGRIAG